MPIELGLFLLLPEVKLIPKMELIQNRVKIAANGIYVASDCSNLTQIFDRNQFYHKEHSEYDFEVFRKYFGLDEGIKQANVRFGAEKELSLKEFFKSLNDDNF